MKKLLLIFALVMAAGTTASANTNRELSDLWDQANTHYINGDYAGSLVLYDSIRNQGYVGSKLYYNMANAYFKNNELGKAIVNYNRAQKLSPNDKDIAYNLDVANSYIKDRIDTVPEFFLDGWTRGLRSMLTTNGWAIVSLLFFAASLGFALMYFLGQKKSLRKTGFFSGIVALVLFCVSVSFSVMERRELLHSSDAIIIASSVAVKSSPDKSSKDIFILHEGTKVDVLNSYNGWKEVLIADGNKGWMLEEGLEMVD